MTGKRLLLVNQMPPNHRDDRASRILAAQGHAVEWCCPASGETLPPANGHFDGVIVYGGSQSANDGDEKPYIRDEIQWIDDWLNTGKPYLGICLGAQLLAKSLGAKVAPHPQGHSEIGYFPIQPTREGASFMPSAMHVYHWHLEGFELPAGATLLATGETFQNQAFRYGEKAFGIQFHPEITPAIAQRWVDEAGHMLGNPGAQSRSEQIGHAERYDAPLGRWLKAFLNGWLRA